MREEFSWPPDAIGTLRTRWADGVTAQAVADELGITKCAVCGKARRLELPKRREGSAGPKRTSEGKAIPSAPPRRPIVEAPKKPTPPPMPAPKADDRYGSAFRALPCSRPISIMKLSDTTCKWPLWSLEASSGKYCGGYCDPGRVYCDGHRMLASAPRGPVRAPISSMSHPAGASKLLVSIRASTQVATTQ